MQEIEIIGKKLNGKPSKLNLQFSYKGTIGTLGVMELIKIE